MAARGSTVCVQGVRTPDGELLSKDILTMHFENCRYGGLISNIDFDERGNRAWVTFEEESSVDKLLAKTHYKLMGCNLTVMHAENVTDGESTETTSGATSTSEMDCIERLDETTERIYSTFESTSMPNLKPPGRNALTTVIITQVPFGMDEEMLEAIIDNPSRGIKMEGTIKSMEIDEKSSVAVVCFSLSSDALTLLQRELLEYQQHTMHVKEPDLDNVTSVRITKVPVDMDEDILEAIIDNPSRGIKMEGTIKSMEIDDESSVAIVCFSSSSDAQKLLRRGFLEYGQQRMMVKEPARPHPAAVLVTGINNTLDQETFKIFFSSPRKTCGDEIAEIKHFEPEHGFAVIIYTRETRQCLV